MPMSSSFRCWERSWWNKCFAKMSSLHISTTKPRFPIRSFQKSINVPWHNTLGLGRIESAFQALRCSKGTTPQVKQKNHSLSVSRRGEREIALPNLLDYGDTELSVWKWSHQTLAQVVPLEESPSIWKGEKYKKERERPSLFSASPKVGNTFATRQQPQASFSTKSRCENNLHSYKISLDKRKSRL